MSLLEEIQAKCTPGQIAAGDFHVIADLVSIGRIKAISKQAGIGTVLETLGPANGSAFLDSLEAMSATVPAVKWAMKLVDRGELDFGAASTRAMIDQLLPPDVAAALKAVAEVPDPVGWEACRAAVQGA